MLNKRQLIIALGVCVAFFSGCDAIYRLIQKEGAQERDLIGEVLPFESNRHVVEVQKLLKLYGYGVGSVDGQLGPNTRYAIEKFQKDHGLKVTRFVDNDTWERLNYFADSGLVVDGEISVAVVQRALRNAGFNPGKIDGKMGPRTARAVTKFQSAMGLQADGAIGYKTLMELNDFLPLE